MKQMCEPHDCILLDLAAWQVKKYKKHSYLEMVCH